MYTALLVTSVLVTFSFSDAVAHSKCKSMAKGSITSFGKHIKMFFPKGPLRWNLPLPSVCKGSLRPVGVKLSLCDHQAAFSGGGGVQFHPREETQSRTRRRQTTSHSILREIKPCSPI